MKTLVLGLEFADADVLFGLDELPFLRRLMEVGCFGRLEGVTSSTRASAWTSLVTSQDPGNSQEVPVADSSSSITGQSIWDQLAREGKVSILVGVPPSDRPREIRGIDVGCLMTVDDATAAFTQPAEVSEEIRDLLGAHPPDIKGPETRGHGELLDRIVARSQAQFRVVRHLLQSRPWDYFQLVDRGLEQLHHGLDRDERGPGSRYFDAVVSYYRHLDDEIGKILEQIVDETVVLVVSPPGLLRPEGAFEGSDRGSSSRTGAFILAGPIHSLAGEIHGVRLLDIAPTLLDLAGHEIPQSMQGRSLVGPGTHETPARGRPEADDEQLIRERLSGLGYI